MSRKEAWSLTELADLAGIAPRTIRYYVARGILPGPDQAGRHASYDEVHLGRLQEISRLKQQGLTLAEITVSLSAESAPAALAAPTTWHHFRLAEDVSVRVRGDIAPWRMRGIRRILVEAQRQLAEVAVKEVSDE